MFRWILSPVFLLISLSSFASVGDILKSEEGRAIYNQILKDQSMMEAPLTEEAIIKIITEQIGLDRAEKIHRKVQTQKRSLFISTATTNRSERVIVAPGYSTSLIFLDSSGHPFEVTDYIIGAQESFNIIQPQAKHILLVSPSDFSSRSNLQVLLKGETSMVTLILDSVNLRPSSEELADEVVELVMPTRSPDTPGENIASSLSNPESKLNGTLLSFLDRVPPDDARQISISNPEPGEFVWQYQGKYYFRTRETVFFPVYSRVVKGRSGFSVFELSPNRLIRVFKQSGGERIIEVSDD